MKTRTLIIAATALIGFSAPAFADCPGAGQTFSDGIDANTQKIHDKGKLINKGWKVANHHSDSGDKTSTDCYTPRAHGFGHGLAVSGTIVADPDNSDKGEYGGPNGTALGNGALVGRWETYKDKNGDEQKRLVPVADGTALGAHAVVEHDHSTAVGADSKSTDDHQLALGTKDDTIRAEGITSEKSKARQQGPVEVVTSDSGGRLATDGGEIFSRLDKHQRQIGENSEGVAIAMSMPDAFLDSTENFSIAAGFGGFEGESAFGAIGSARIDKTFSLYAGGGMSLSGEHFGWKVGARAGW